LLLHTQQPWLKRPLPLSGSALLHQIRAHCPLLSMLLLLLLRQRLLQLLLRLLLLLVAAMVQQRRLQQQQLQTEASNASSRQQQHQQQQLGLQPRQQQQLLPQAKLQPCMQESWLVWASEQVSPGLLGCLLACLPPTCRPCCLSTLQQQHSWDGWLLLQALLLPHSCPWRLLLQAPTCQLCSATSLPPCRG
jgi:hypothetical protein